MHISKRTKIDPANQNKPRRLRQFRATHGQNIQIGNMHIFIYLYILPSKSRPSGPRRTCARNASVPRRVHFLHGGAPRPALGRLGKARGEGGRELYSAPRPDLAASRGRGPSARCALSPPRSRRDCRPGRTVLSAPPTASSGRGPALVKGVIYK